MAKIRSLGRNSLRQVLSLLERCGEDESDYPVLEHFRTLYLPFHGLNEILPPALRFLPGIYVAISDGKVLGLVWLSRDGFRADRWKIEQVILDPDSYAAYDVGKQLMYYVINRFGAAGVETFLAYVDPHYDEGLALLKDCGFRHCTKLHTYTAGPDIAALKETPVQISGLREARPSDGRKLQELHSETLVPEVRISLRRSPGDFCPPLFTRMLRRCQGRFSKRWVVAPGNGDYLMGSVSISTWNFKEFTVSVLISPAWEDGAGELIRLAVRQICKSTSTPQITVEAFDFQKAKVATLVDLGFELASTTELLVKDYWIPAKDNALRVKSPVLLFARGGWTSPA